ncbi:unnamed protein product [Brachionus calyciflorus]|uniref:Uncharacterized protein n=1 Tax=Brachionus calyciflorus TaxID=104777 RepID=A0A814PX48_9BILA|nr:unnamed protein product [Brachionus calyciflorus]
MAQNFFTNCEIFLKYLTQEALLAATKEIVQMGRDNFSDMLNRRFSDDDKKEKNDLNKVRITFGKYVLQRLGINNDQKFVNRSRVKTIGNDIWNLISSLGENRLVSECNEMFKNNQKCQSDTMNNTQMEVEQNIDQKHEMTNLLERLLNEIDDLKSSNKEILDKMKVIINENNNLKKIVLNLGKFKNFSYFEQSNYVPSSNDIAGKEKELDSSDLMSSSPKINKDITKDIVNENVFKVPLQIKPSYAYPNGSSSNLDKNYYDIRRINRPKFVIGSQRNNNENGLFGAKKQFEYYSGFWRLDTTKEKVQEYIKKFADVEKIEYLNTENKDYKSFYIAVNSQYDEQMLKPENWPSNVLIKRFFKSKKSDKNKAELNENRFNRRQNRVYTNKYNFGSKGKQLRSEINGKGSYHGRFNNSNRDEKSRRNNNYGRGASNVATLEEVVFLGLITDKILSFPL